MKNYETLNSPLMRSEEINFILVGPSQDQIFSSLQKEGRSTRNINVPRNTPTGMLLLPLIKLGIE